MRKTLLLAVFLCLSSILRAEQLEVQEYLGYMWKSISEVNFGEVAVNSTTRYMKNNQPLKLASDVSFGNVKFTASDASITASINPDKTIYLSITPKVAGAYSQTITVSADGYDDLVITANATAVSLSYPTISELREKATAYNTVYQYEGNAVVSAIEGKMLWVYDDTDAIMLQCAEDPTLVPGDVITFNGTALSPGNAWNSLMSVVTNKVATFNWKEPKPEIIDGALNDSHFGHYVRLPKVRYTREVVKDAGSVKFCDYYFEDGDGNEFHVRSYSTDGAFAEYSFEEGVDYDLTGYVWHYSPDSMTKPSPTISLSVVRTTVPPVALTTGDWRCDAQLLGEEGKKMMKLQVSVDEKDPYRYLFKNFINDTENGSSEVYGTVAPDGKSIAFYVGQQLDGISTAEVDKYFTALDAQSHPYKKGEIVVAPLTVDGDLQSFSLDCAIANVNHNLTNSNNEWSYAGAYNTGALYSNQKIPTVEVQEYLGYMWKALTEINFGNVATGQKTTYSKNNKPLKLVVDGLEMTDVTIACSDESIAAQVEGEELFLSIKPETDGEFTGSVVFSAGGDELLTLAVTANAVNMSYETIAELKEKASDDTLRYFYTGNAVVGHVENNVVWANDETGGVQLVFAEPQSFVPGDVINFNGVVMSPNYDWKSFIRVEAELVDCFNWKEPVAKVVETALTADNYGCLVRLPKVHYTKCVSAESYGITYNDYYFEDEDGNEYHVRSYASDGEYSQYEDFEKNVDYDLTGCVWAYSKDTMTMPHPTLNLTLVRSSEAPISLATGDWHCNAEFIIWQGTKMDFELEVIADPNDPYRYQFKNFVYDFNGGDCTIYGTVTPDGKAVEFYTGQQLDGHSTTLEDKFFSGYDNFQIWNDNPTMAPYSKGEKIVGELVIDGENQKIIMNNCFGNMQHNLYAIDSNPSVEWGTTGAYLEGAVYMNGKASNGVSSITSDSEEELPMYYDIVGHRVMNPVKGTIYIMKQGKTVKKIVY